MPFHSKKSPNSKLLVFVSNLGIYVESILFLFSRRFGLSFLVAFWISLKVTAQNYDDGSMDEMHE
jgi:hypothetical protein